ncbi:MAG: hypothetical protein VYA67_26295 [Actinomycetota bacterium]|nr:hypothetical protein [Actinomycetota bacterium]
MRMIVDLTTRVLGVSALVIASAIASGQHAAALPPPRFPNLDGFTAVPADGYVSTSLPGNAPRIIWLFMIEGVERSAAVGL